LTAQIDSPTDDRRHMPKIRYGAISAELNCRNPKRREELGLPPIPEPDQMVEETTGTKLPTRRPKKR
jgi:hypothetical protein